MVCIVYRMYSGFSKNNNNTNSFKECCDKTNNNNTYKQEFVIKNPNHLLQFTFIYFMNSSKDDDVNNILIVLNKS